MSKFTTAHRLKQVMEARGLRQVDILNAADPFCKKHNVKLGKNDLSQYIAGKVVPGQDKLTILGLALNVSEAWLMGYDVPASRDYSSAFKSEKDNFPSEGELTEGNDKNIIRIAGRDGSYVEKRLTDEQLAAVKTLISQLPDADF